MCAKRWLGFPKLAHLREETQITIARQAVRAEANIEPKRAQFPKGKGRMAKVRVAARTMHNMKTRRARQQLEIVSRQFIQMRDNPTRLEQATFH